MKTLLLQEYADYKGGRMNLLSSESGFDLLTLIEVLQADLPESCQVLLRTKTETLRTEGESIAFMTDKNIKNKQTKQTKQ